MPFLQVAYETGLRRGSLLAIRHEDIEADWLRIDGSSTKTLKRQSFRLSEQTISTLRDIWDPPRERMFDYDNEGTSYKHFHLLIVAANIRRCRRKGLNMFHMIRRTTATLIAARAGVTAASSMLGHSDIYVNCRYVDLPHLRHDAAAILPSLAAS